MGIDITRYIDHSVLKPEMTRAAAYEAIRYGVENRTRTVCVRPCDIEIAVELCRGSETDPCCVLAFPHGCVPPEVKAFEASVYIGKGIKEIDMVANFGFINSGMWDEVRKDIMAVSELTRKAGVILKVIFETCTLSVNEIRRATETAIESGADFIKTSTGFHSGGATPEAVRTMVEAAKGRIGVKASGGIRDRETALKYIEMGCTRIGAGYTSTPALLGK
jgi:deoxyribose-phosphate aldolase